MKTGQERAGPGCPLPMPPASPTCKRFHARHLQTPSFSTCCGPHCRAISVLPMAPPPTSPPAAASFSQAPWVSFFLQHWPHSALPKARVLSPVTARKPRSFIFGLPPLPSPYPHAPQTRLLGAKYMFVDVNCWIGNQQQGLQKNFLRLRKSGCTEQAWTGNETFPRAENSLNCPKC